MKKANQILLLSAFLLTFMITKSINVMQDTEEIWKDVPGYFGKVQASSLGRIKTFYKNSGGRVLKLQKGLRGKYLRVQLKYSSDYQSVHRLVALAWHDNPNKLPVVRHLDDNGLNNKSDNLKWDTQSNNILFGPRGKNTPYPELHKQLMREAFQAGFSKLSIAKYFKITDTGVRRVVQS